MLRTNYPRRKGRQGAPSASACHPASVCTVGLETEEAPGLGSEAALLQALGWGSRCCCSPLGTARAARSAHLPLSGRLEGRVPQMGPGCISGIQPPRHGKASYPDNRRHHSLPQLPPSTSPRHGPSTCIPCPSVPLNGFGLAAPSPRDRAVGSSAGQPFHSLGLNLPPLQNGRKKSAW